MTSESTPRYDAKKRPPANTWDLLFESEDKWAQRVSEIGRRHRAIHAIKEDWEKVLEENYNSKILSFVDVFVENAQDRITRKAGIFYFFGILLATFVITILYNAYETISNLDLKFLFEVLDSYKKHDLDGYVMIFLFMRSVGLAALVGGGAYFLGSLSTACLHEATALLNRRHALRQGRLYMYLKFANVSESARDIKEEISINELEQAFGWNSQSTSAFRTIKLDPLTASIYAKAIEALAKPLAPSASAKK